MTPHFYMCKHLQGTREYMFVLESEESVQIGDVLAPTYPKGRRYKVASREIMYNEHRQSDSCLLIIEEIL